MLAGKLSANFEPGNKCVEVEGSVDPDIVVEKFASHFSSAYMHNNEDRSKALCAEYDHVRSSYCAFLRTDNHTMDTELVSNVIFRLHVGNAVDITRIAAEHLVYSHPSLSVVLCKFFTLIIQVGCVPSGLRYSYTAPISKLKDCRVKSMSCDDFRGIAISPILSKVFEYSLLDRCGNFLTSSDLQFGFKKGLSCRKAIYRV